MKLEMMSAPSSLKLSESVETPFQRARAQWDERYGSAVAQAENWRRIAFLTVLLGFILTAGNIYQSFTNQVTPVVIEVSREDGEPRVLGKVGQFQFTANEAQKRWYLTNFLRDVREVTADPVVLQRRWENVYHRVTPQAKNLINEFARSEDSPLSQRGQIVSQVQIISINKVTEHSYQVRWNEKIFSIRGDKRDEYVMSAVVSLVDGEPKKEEEIMGNPLGLYIVSINWSKEK